MRMYRPGEDAGDGRVVYVLVMMALGAYLTVPQSLLTLFGIPYTAPTGSFIYKLHPGTYLLSVALVLALFRSGNPLTALAARLKETPLLAFYLIGIVVPMVYSLLRYGFSGSAFFIDTLLMPAAIALLMTRFSREDLRSCYLWILSLVLLNAAISLVEALFEHHLIPFTLSGGIPVVVDKFRSAALYGHPLDGSIITGTMLLASIDQPLGPLKRLALYGFLILALLAFGGRTSLILSVSVLLTHDLITISRKLLRGAYDYLRIVAGLIVSMLALPAFVGLVWVSSLGERIFTSLYYDDSASVRVRIFGVLRYLDAYDLLFGIPPTVISNIAIRIGLDPNYNAIENFWLFMLLQFGVIVLAVFVIGFFCGMRLLWRRVGIGGRCALVVFLLTASTTNSLVSKTSVLTLLFAVLYGLNGLRIQIPKVRIPARVRGGGIGYLGARP